MSALRLALLVLVAALLGEVAPTSAAFDGRATNAGTVTTDVVLPATTLSGVADGTDVDLTWSAGALQSGAAGVGHAVSGRLLGVEAGTRDGLDPPAGCTPETGTWTWSSRLAEGDTDVTHTDVGASSVAGSWWCYRAVAEYPASPATAVWWREPAQALTRQVGHVIRSIELVDGGTPGVLTDGDRVVVTFNQAVDPATGPQDTEGTGVASVGNDVCIHSTGNAMVLGRATSLLNSNCAAANANVLARVNADITADGQRNAYHASYDWAPDCATAEACVLTVTIGERYRGNTDVAVTNPTSSLPTATAGALLTPGGTALCGLANNGSHTCRPVPVGSL